MKDFRGKVAVITGAGSGIGRSLVVQLSQEGVHLALGDIDQENLSQTREKHRRDELFHRLPPRMDFKA